jgi:hypothetical protein
LRALANRSNRCRCAIFICATIKFDVDGTLLAQPGVARQQFPVVAKHRYDCLGTVPTEFLGNHSRMSFSFLQRREFFTDVIGQSAATVLRLEEIVRHRKPPTGRAKGTRVELQKYVLISRMQSVQN